MNVYNDGRTEEWKPPGIAIGDKCWAGQFIQTQKLDGTWTMVTPTTLGRLDGFYENGKAQVWFGEKFGHLEADPLKLKGYGDFRDSV